VTKKIFGFMNSSDLAFYSVLGYLTGTCIGIHLALS
jgi:hypothetical protein